MESASCEEARSMLLVMEWEGSKVVMVCFCVLRSFVVVNWAQIYCVRDVVGCLIGLAII